MAASLRNPADVVNAALVPIGYKNMVGHLYDGSEAAQLALAIYGQARDDLLKASDWDFCLRSLAMTQLKSAPPGGYFPPVQWDPNTNPPVPWLYEYEYPSDCLKVRAVKPTPLFLPNFAPSPNEFSIANDVNYTPARRVILCNIQNSLLTYSARITDPSTWAVDFTESLIDMLGEKLSAGLATLDAAKMKATEGMISQGNAEMEQG